MARKRPGFAEGFASTFGPTAQATTLAMIRELLAEPPAEEKDIKMQIARQQIKSPEQLTQEGKRRALELQELEAKTKEREVKTARLSRFPEIQKEDDATFKLAIGTVQRNPLFPFMSAEDQQIRIVDAFEMLKAVRAGKPAIEKPKPQSFKTAEDVKKAVQSKTLSPQKGVEILKSQFGF